GLILVCGHITIMCTSLYLHRSLTHQALIFHPIAAFPMRLWLWLITGMAAREWVAVHRKHHAHCETENDPHSPVVHGWASILFLGVKYYRRESQNPETIEKFGKGVPVDALERKWFEPMKYAGPFILLALTFYLFGWLQGLVFWTGLIIWVPFWAAGVVNGLGHTIGYRNYEVEDESRNLSPIGLLLSGEELHNNHHRFPSSPKFSRKWFEFDMGWLYIRILLFLHLAHLRLDRESLT
ncbi:MAG TPA: fatty acid desaturase, partial [Saprospiraceae bacterium]|nr:fatty acid desaturase [Saprospiraceae bacterium]